MITRFIIAIDVEGDTLVEAYKNLDKVMHQEVPAREVSWETTDDVFDEDGELENHGVVQDAIMQAFKEIRTGSHDFPDKNTDHGNVCLECDALINYGPRSSHEDTCKYYRGN